MPTQSFIGAQYTTGQLEESMCMIGLAFHLEILYTSVVTVLANPIYIYMYIAFMLLITCKWVSSMEPWDYFVNKSCWLHEQVFSSSDRLLESCLDPPSGLSLGKSVVLWRFPWSLYVANAYYCSMLFQLVLVAIEFSQVANINVMC